MPLSSSSHADPREEHRPGNLVGSTSVAEPRDGILENRYCTGSDTTSSCSMTEQERLYFDRQGNRFNGQLWASEKGVGLSARLTRLRKDRR